jgi:predicted nucleic acid-binding protein
MTLVDTSVWVDHFRNGNTELQNLLQSNEVLMHPFIMGELSCGTMRNRGEILRLLQELPEARVAEHEEVLGLVERKRLWGRGIGWIDVHLLASALLSRSTIWTLDRQLSRVASSLALPSVTMRP